jgi:thiol-disulfide isomerase/thioredoxin
MSAMSPLRVIGCAALASVACCASAETWEATNGAKIEGKLTSVHGPLAVITDKAGSQSLPLDELNDAALARVADFLAAKPADAPWAGSTSKVAKALKGRLQVLRGEKLVDFDPAARKEPEFYLVYFGADWCPPCRAFSPKLVEAYHRLQKAAPDKFEVVFVSSDREGAEQLKYVRHVNMPWPVLRFSQVGRAPAIERWAGSGIPCLVVITREGEALVHSYRGAEYVGPYDVLEKFETLLQLSAPNNPETKRRLHRLAVMQHVRGAAGGDKPAAPYALAMDLRRYQTLEVKTLTATLEIDEHGRVADAAIEPELPAVLNHQLVNDAGTWLFLPAVEKGRATRKTAKLPISLRN